MAFLSPSVDTEHGAAESGLYLLKCSKLLECLSYENIFRFYLFLLFVH